MATLSVTANSLSGQIQQLVNQFQAVEKSAATFEVQQTRATDLLHTALENVFAFGEALIALPSPAGASVIGEFFKQKNVAYNARTQANPYIGLVKLAFANASDSSRSQYSTVLQFAGASNISPSAFKSWLVKGGGIEGCRDMALTAQVSKTRQKNNSGKATRLQQATADLLARPASVPVALPAGMVAPEGFAIVLAKIDQLNHASIVHVIHDQSAADKIDPVLMQVAGAPVATAPATALGKFYRAIDLILGTTPDAPEPKHPRDILISNVEVRGNLFAIFEGISTAYSFPSAIVTVAGYVGDLPTGSRFVLSAADATAFLQQHDAHQNWALDANGLLTADGLSKPIQLTKLPTSHSYRVADVNMQTDKQLRATMADLEAVIAYVEQEREAHDLKNAKVSAKRAFPKMLDLSLNNTRLDVKLSTSLRVATLAETSAEQVADDRTVDVAELKAIAETLVRYGVDADGWLMDGQVDDAAVVLEAFLDDDHFRVMLPTRVGSNYNQTTKPLV